MGSGLSHPKTPLRIHLRVAFLAWPFNRRFYVTGVSRNMKNRRWAGKRSGIAFGAVALILTALVVPYACAGTTGAVPFSGDNPSSGTRTVTIADITDFHGHIERGADNATAFTVADSHNPGNMIPVSTGDLVGGSPYESAVEKDQPRWIWPKRGD